MNCYHVVPLMPGLAEHLTYALIAGIFLHWLGW